MEKMKIVETRNKNSNLRVKFDIIQSLRELFAENLNEMYWTESLLLKTTPNQVLNASSIALKQVLTLHIDESTDNLVRLKNILEYMEENFVPKKCDMMESLITDVESALNEGGNNQLRDAKIINGFQKIMHYKIASYRRLFAFATTLGESILANIISEMLNNEKKADEILTKITRANSRLSIV